MGQPQTTHDVQRLVDETKPLIEAADRGEFERATWTAIADRLIKIQELEPTWGHKRIGALFGKGETWSRTIVHWRTNSRTDAPSPFTRGAVPSAGGDRDRPAARKVLAEQPQSVAPEIAKAMEDPEVREAVAKHMAPSTARDLSDAVRGLPHEPAERERRRREADAFADDYGGPIRDTFSKLAVILHLEQARDELSDMSSITGAAYEEILALLKNIEQEAEIKRAMAEVA